MSKKGPFSPLELHKAAKRGMFLGNQNWSEFILWLCLFVILLAFPMLYSSNATVDGWLLNLNESSILAYAKTIVGLSVVVFFVLSILKLLALQKQRRVLVFGFQKRDFAFKFELKDSASSIILFIVFLCLNLFFCIHLISKGFLFEVELTAISMFLLTLNLVFILSIYLLANAFKLQKSQESSVKDFFYKNLKSSYFSNKLSLSNSDRSNEGNSAKSSVRNINRGKEKLKDRGKDGKQ